MKVSIIIPVFNESAVIANCLNSLKQQNYKDLEIIIIDDGSTDDTQKIVGNFPVKLLRQDHRGPGVARNLGAKEANGQVLVFVDADMEFDSQFIAKLVDPIIKGQVIGTFSKEEFVLNKDNVWSKCWNINKGLPINKMHNKDYPDQQAVFRAILKTEFDKAGGFGAIGYIDDHTIAEKLQTSAVAAPGAVFCHRNPDNLKEIYQQARWIGKSEYKRRKIKDENLMRLIALVRYSLPFSFLSGIAQSVQHGLPQFLIFKIVYDWGVELSLLKSFTGEQKYR